MNRVPRVLVYSQVPPPRHGSAVMTETLITALTTLGHNPLLLDRRFSRQASDVGRVSLGKLLSLPSLLARAARERVRLRRSDYVIFFTTNRTGSFLVDCIVKSILSVRGPKIIHYVHTFGYAELAGRGKPWQGLVRYLFYGAEAVVTLSARHIVDLHGLTGTAPLLVRANATSHFEKDVAPSRGERFVYFATVSKEKGVEDFLKVAESFHRRGRTTSFEIYGAVSDPSALSTILDSAHRLTNLRYMGEATTMAEKQQALSGAIALLYPSRYQYEAQPLAIIEAMALGTPTISYSRGAIDELINGANGVIVQDVEALIRAAEDLCDNASSTELRARTAREFERGYSMGAYSEFWRGVIR